MFNKPLNDNAYQACYKQCSKLTLTIGHGSSLYERDLSMCCYSIYMLPRECTMPSAVACDFGKTLFLSKPRSPRSSKRTAYHSTYLVQSRVHGPRELSDREPPGQLNRRSKAHSIWKPNPRLAALCTNPVWKEQCSAGLP
jgi:hypothetical protein